MKNRTFNIFGSFVLCIACSYTMANEVYNPNPFAPPPSATSENRNINLDSMDSRRHNDRIDRLDRNNRGNPPEMSRDLNPVTQALTEKEIRSNKILESINSKMANAKNIPIENSRYVGVINGKRIYQNIDTSEYVKIEMQNN